MNRDGQYERGFTAGHKKGYDKGWKDSLSWDRPHRRRIVPALLFVVFLLECGAAWYITGVTP